jgi:hypothetical protein
MVKLDLSSEFFLLAHGNSVAKYYGLYYAPAHTLAPGIMQRFYQRYRVSMMAGLDDWLLFGPWILNDAMLQSLR